MSTKLVELVNIRGETDIHISVEITSEGDLLFSGQDLGKAPFEFFDDIEYEYWLRIPHDQKDKVILALIDESPSSDIPETAKQLFGSIDNLQNLDWSSISIRQKDQFLLALIEEHYTGNPGLVSDFQRLLKSKGIKSKFFSYS